jgi:hypothetical protein
MPPRGSSNKDACCIAARTAVETEGAAAAANGRLREVECAACRAANRVVHATVADQANRCASTLTPVAASAVTTNRST